MPTASPRLLRAIHTTGRSHTRRRTSAWSTAPGRYARTIDHPCPRASASRFVECSILPQGRRIGGECTIDLRVKPDPLWRLRHLPEPRHELVAIRDDDERIDHHHHFLISAQLRAGWT